jgi:two-component system, LytTR family, response regulator
MKALIVDDEPLARRELRRLLTAFPWVQVVGEAADVDQALTQMEELSPTLIFLDVQMPGGTGFDLLAQLERLPRVIFTTAYDHYAVKAFEVSAVDYLLKPIEPERLSAALSKVQAAALAAMSSTPPATELTSKQEAPLEQIFVRDGLRCWFVPLREVSVFTADGNYVRLQWGKESPMLGRSLVALEEKLDSRRFFRANRRQIVNLDYIESVEMGLGGRLHVQLRGGPEIEISRRQARQFRARMSV